MSNHFQRSRSAEVIQRHFTFQLNQSTVCAAVRFAPPEQHRKQRQRHHRRVHRGLEPGAPPGPAAVVEPHRVRREAHQAEEAPAICVTEENQQRDWHEQPAAQFRPLEPAQPQPKAEGQEGKRDRQGEVHEAEQERVAVDERQGEECGRRHPPMDLTRHPEKAGGGQWRDHQDDQLHRGLEPHAACPAG